MNLLLHDNETFIFYDFIIIHRTKVSVLCWVVILSIAWWMIKEYIYNLDTQTVLY